MDNKKQKAKKIVKLILEDLTDRRGLKQVWYQIDKDIQKQIKDTWINIILDVI